MDQAMTALSAGTGRRDISPEKPMFLWGYPHVERMSTGIHDPLYATAIALSDGVNTTLVVSVDVLYVTASLVSECRRRIQARTGIPPQQVMVGATHTHSGPVTARILAMSGDPVVPAPDPDYLERLTSGIVESACEAVETMEPAALAVTSAHIDGVGCNRLDPSGPRDPDAGMAVVRRLKDDTCLAILLLYAMHPTILHEDSTLVSADFPGFTRHALETAHPGARVIYLNGMCGNLSPRYHVKGQTFDEAERFGKRLAGFVDEAVKALRASDFRTTMAVGGSLSRVPLVPRQFPPVAEAEHALQAAKAEYERLQREGAPHGPLRTAECVTFGAEEVVTMARAQSSGELARLHKMYAEAEVQVLSVGDWILAGVPGEWFVEYSLDIKKRAGSPVLVASMTNGELQGYITTPGATGYEAGLSMFVPENGESMVRVLLELVAEELRRGAL